ncbi:MAG: hypothetical protein IMY73_03460 [Bacteroidetes bacterium]|nr:hypothetical protein [Bacteroidota bacterium]
MFAYLQTNAQEYVNILKELEVPDTTYNSTVTVNNNVNINLMPKKDNVVDAYRIRLYFNNNQNSRSEAYSIKNKFNSLYPSIPANVEYKAPNFIVTAGYFLTHIEATVFLSNVERDFINAFIIPIKVPISTFKHDVIVNNINQDEEKKEN